jgi:hypothetical protein
MIGPAACGARAAQSSFASKKKTNKKKNCERRSFSEANSMSDTTVIHMQLMHCALCVHCSLPLFACLVCLIWFVLFCLGKAEDRRPKETEKNKKNSGQATLLPAAALRNTEPR